MSMFFQILRYLPQILSAGAALFRLVEQIEHLKSATAAIKLAQTGDLGMLKDQVSRLEGK